MWINVRIATASQASEQYRFRRSTKSSEASNVDYAYDCIVESQRFVAALAARQPYAIPAPQLLRADGEKSL